LNYIHKVLHIYSLKLGGIIQSFESLSLAFIAFKLSCLRLVRLLAKNAYYLLRVRLSVRSSVRMSDCIRAAATK
jgi:hypothetical protein